MTSPDETPPQAGGVPARRETAQELGKRVQTMVIQGLSKPPPSSLVLDADHPTFREGYRETIFDKMEDSPNPATEAEWEQFRKDQESWTQLLSGEIRELPAEMKARFGALGKSA